MNSITSAMADLAVRNQLSEQENDANNHRLIAKPKPRKPVDTGSSYTPSSPHQKGSSQLTNSTQSIEDNTNSRRLIKKSSTNAGLSSSMASGAENILLKTFGNLSGNSGGPLNGQTLFNAVTNSNKSAVSPANLRQNNAPSPSKLSPQKPMIYDHKKLGVLSQFVKTETNTGHGNVEDSQSAALVTPSGKTNSEVFMSCVV